MKKSALILMMMIYCTGFAQTDTFFEAVSRNETNLAHYMIKHRADIKTPNEDGLTPLHVVQDAGLALALIQNGADVSATNRKGSAPLHWAVSRKHPEIVKVLLEFGADPDQPDNEGNTPLHFAVNSSEEVILLLLRSGADANAQNKAGSTPIIESLQKNNSAHSKYLILAGAEDIQNNAGIKPSILESMEKPDSLKPALLTGRVDPLIREIFVENYPRAIALIERDVPLYNIDVNGNSPLHWAFQKKERYISRLLLEKGADYRAYNFNDQTPIDVLIAGEDEDFIIYVQDLLKDATNFYPPAKN